MQRNRTSSELRDKPGIGSLLRAACQLQGGQRRFTKHPLLTRRSGDPVAGAGRPLRPMGSPARPTLQTAPGSGWWVAHSLQRIAGAHHR